MPLAGFLDMQSLCIFQEELKIVTMKYSLLQEEELNNREVELVELLAHKKEAKVKLQCSLC